MINYFFFPASFRETNTTLIKNCIDDLNKALIKNERNETFYDDNTFYITEYSNGQTLYAKLSQSHKDLSNRIIPSILRRMKHTTTNISSDLTILNTTYPDAWANCLWGCFVAEDRNHISSYDFFCSNRRAIAKGIVNGTNLSDISSLLFDRIRIARDAMEQICDLGSGGDFKIVMDAICSLDSYNTNMWNTGSFQIRALQKDYNVTISDESDTVKRTPRLMEQRYFKVSEKIGSQYCFYHVKLGDIRMHIYPNEEERIMYVAYVGAHLDLK